MSISVFRSVSNSLISVFNTITDVADTAGESVQIATTYVHNRAIEQKLTDNSHVRLSTAKSLRAIQVELEGDEALTKIFEDLEQEFA